MTPDEPLIHPPLEYLQAPGPQLWELYPCEYLLTHRRQIAWYLSCWHPTEQLDACRRWWYRFRGATRDQWLAAWETLEEVLSQEQLADWWTVEGARVPSVLGSAPMAAWLDQRQPVTALHPDWWADCPSRDGQGRGQALAYLVARGHTLPAEAIQAETLPVLWCHWLSGDHVRYRPGRWLRLAARAGDAALLEAILEHWPSLTLRERHLRESLLGVVERTRAGQERRTQLQAAGRMIEIQPCTAVADWLSLARLWPGGHLRPQALLPTAFCLEDTLEGETRLPEIWDWIWTAAGRPSVDWYYLLSMQTLRRSQFRASGWLMARTGEYGREVLVYPEWTGPGQLVSRWGELGVPEDQLEEYSTWLSLVHGCHLDTSHGWYDPSEMSSHRWVSRRRVVILQPLRYSPPICPPLHHPVSEARLQRMRTRYLGLALEQLCYRGDHQRALDLLDPEATPASLCRDGKGGFRVAGALAEVDGFYYHTYRTASWGRKAQRGREKYLVERWAGVLVLIALEDTGGLVHAGDQIYYTTFGGYGVPDPEEILEVGRRYLAHRASRPPKRPVA